MDIALATAILVFSQSPALGWPEVVARPEAPNANVVHVGQTLVIPLYDGTVAALSFEGLRPVGQRRIRRHDLFEDLGTRSMFGGYDAASERGAAFIVERPGRGSVNVTLRLPRLKVRCVSCRTLHFFYRAQR